MRLLITGSRSWSDKDRLWQVLDSTAEALAHHNRERYITEGLHLVSGHAYGADALGEAWFLERFPLEEPEVWRADWRKHGRRAGPIRNVAMVDSGPDLCVAFIMPCDKDNCTRGDLHGSHGAVHCADYAAEKGVPTTRFYGGALL